MMSNQKYIVTPDLIHKGKVLPNNPQIAFVCYCPMPYIFKELSPLIQSTERYFLHCHPDQVLFTTIGKLSVVVIAEVYGGPVSVSVIEELKFYGVETVIGIGFLGSMNTYLQIGENVIAICGSHETGATSEYCSNSKEDSEYLTPNYNLKTYISSVISNLKIELQYVSVWTTNSIYTETSEKVQEMVAQGFNTVNMDTSHFYASAKRLGLNAVYLGTITDNLVNPNQWENQLTESSAPTESEIAYGYISDHSSSELDDINLKVTIIEAQDTMIEGIFQGLEYFFLINKIEKLFKKFENDGVKVCNSNKIPHFINVLSHVQHALYTDYNNKLFKLTDDKNCYELCHIQAIELAALLHDLDDHKFFPGHDDYQNLREITKEYQAEIVTLVVEMVSYVSSSKNGNQLPMGFDENPWILYPRWANRLEYIGEEGLRRCYQYCITIGTPLCLPETLRAENEEDLWVRIATKERYESYKGKSVSMIDHIYDKLLRMAEFNTNNQYFLEESRERLRQVVDFALEFGKEGKVTDKMLERYGMLY